MRKRIDELKQTLHGFIDQSDDLVLVISARDSDMPLCHKVIEGVDLEQPADIVLRFGHEARGAVPYVDGVMASVDAQIEGVNAVRGNEGLTPWPKLPPACHDVRQSVDQRVKAAMQHVRGLFPRDEDHRVLWCFLPSAITDTAGYATLIGRLLPRDGIQPWMHSQRIVARDDRDKPFLVPHLHEQKIEGTLVFHADFSTEAMLDGMADEVKDPETPEPERMQKLLVLAAVDFGYKRYGQAVEKYGICYEWFEKNAQPVQQGVCLGGVGDVLFATGRVAEAKQRYQQGLAHAAPQGVGGLPVVMLLAAKAGDACMARKEYREAADYFDMASQVAGKLLSLEFKCDQMEKLGLARAANRDTGGAVTIWEQAIGICKEGEYFIRWRSILANMAAFYGDLGIDQKQREAQREHAAIDRICKERYV